MRNEFGERLDRNGYAPSLLQCEYNQNECFMCGAICEVARHEVFYGTANRENSKRLGCWVMLCPGCHRELHEKHKGDNGLKQYAQYIAMNHYSWTEDDFRRFFGKSYV